MNKDVVFYLVSSAVALAVGAFVFWGPSIGPRKRRVPIVGLKNLGSTCFLNALLQALASCPIFIDWLELREEHESISQSLAHLLKILSTELGPDSNNGGTVPYSPLEIITSLRRNGWTVSPGEQDAHELFHHLILTIEEEETRKCKAKVSCRLSDLLIPLGSNPPNVKSSVAPISSFVNLDKKNKDFGMSSSLQQISTSTPKNKSNGDIVKIHDFSGSDRGDNISMPVEVVRYDVNGNRKPSPFTGFLTSQTHCTKCGFKSVLRYDKFDSLSLHLPPLEFGRNRHTLIQLLDRFVKTEMVSGVSCDGCNKLAPPEAPTIKTAALKSLSIGKLPHCLCIHIPRTLIHSNGEPYKRQDYVDFPEFLAMDPYTQNNMLRELKLKKERLGTDGLDASSLGSDARIGSDEEEKNDAVKREESLGSENVGKIQKLRKINHMYRIKAVIVHRGNLEGGHFVTYRRGPLKSHIRHRSQNQTHQNSHGERRWYLTSDADVQHATLCEALQSPAYMLFYEKCATDIESV